MVSEPPPPRSESFPWSPLMTSLSVPPVIVSLPTVPLNVATSDHPDVGRRDGRRPLDGCHELRIRAARAVRVVVDLPACGVVDDAVVRIVSAGCPGCRKKPRIARAEVPVGPERGECSVVEAQRVPIA